VTLGGSNEHYTPNDSVSAYARYVSGNAVREYRNHAANMRMVYQHHTSCGQKHKTCEIKQWSTTQTMKM